MTIGEKIKAIRIGKGLTQLELGNRCIPPMKDVQIRKYERGEVKPKMENTVRIAYALGVPVSELYSEDYEARLINEVSGLQALEQYLKSLGYSLSYEGPTDTDDPDVVLTKGKEKTTFTGDQFKEFEKAIAASVEYQVWQQRHLKT